MRFDPPGQVFESQKFLEGNFVKGFFFKFFDDYPQLGQASVVRSARVIVHGVIIGIAQAVALKHPAVAFGFSSKHKLVYVIIRHFFGLVWFCKLNSRMAAEIFIGMSWLELLGSQLMVSGLIFGPVSNNLSILCFSLIFLE